MIAVASGRIEGVEMADIDAFNEAVRVKARNLATLLEHRHGPGDTSHTVGTDVACGGVVVRVTWRPKA